jgi:hypothetical protein
MVAAPVVESITETFVSVDADGDFEIIEINETFDDSIESAEVSLETAPIDVVELLEEDEFAEADLAPAAVDDKTRPIELPEKSDNELF